ncbi:hypothetical protein NPIL_275141 [Nephila pilipes]|uniref:Uncharacterized protein n=1 Tax=Nephila pilipes TaxID=299642 RepID=A0A8X6IAE0_NEPPI|nr:hypothetical protein NPIL_275141 [Nephila pilipes]
MRILKSEFNTVVSNKSHWVEKIPNFFFYFCGKSIIIFPGKIQLTGQDKSKWTSLQKVVFGAAVLVSSNTGTAAPNIIHFYTRSEELSKRTFYHFFFTPHMLEKLILQTNSKIRRQKDRYAEQKFAVSVACRDDIKA